MGLIYIIYKITNLVNGKLYIGQTRQTLNKRWSSHKLSSRKPQSILHKAMHCYGISNFKMEPLLYVDNSEDAVIYEYSIIKLYDTCNRNIGYNQISNPYPVHIVKSGFNNQGLKRCGKYKYVGISYHYGSYRAKLYDPFGKAWQKSGFKTEEDAAIFYDLMAINFYGDKAKLNFIELIDEYKVSGDIKSYLNFKTSSIYRGVSFSIQRKAWMASISINKKVLVETGISTEIEASKIYNRWCLELLPEKEAKKRMNILPQEPSTSSLENAIT